MTKTACPAGCGKKFITANHAEKHADTSHPNWKTPKMPKAKGWATPFGFIDFGQPVTYEQACQTAQKLQDSTQMHRGK